jgi:hypothetical protein
VNQTLQHVGRVCGALCILLAGVRCAHVEAPSGGPVDTVRPVVAAVYPAPEATNVPAEARTIFQFSEWIDRNAERGTVMISPPYAGRVQVDVEGDRLIVQPPAGQTLRPRTTHVVTVLGTLKDLRGNPLGEGFNLRFSTGPTLDSAGLTGTLRREDRRGPLIAALYPLDNRSRVVQALSLRDTGFAVSETPEPWRELPRAIASADSTGAFSLRNAPVGAYAVFAFEDLNGNFTFDLGLEPAAVGEPNVALKPLGARQALRLAPLDTLPLRLAEVAFAADSTLDSARADSLATLGLAQGTLLVKFSRPPHPVRAGEASRYVLLPDSGAPLPVRSASWNIARDQWVFEVPALRVGLRHRLVMQSRPDFPGRFGANRSDTSAFFDVLAAPLGAPLVDPLSLNLTPLLSQDLTRTLAVDPSGVPQTAPSPAPGQRPVFATSRVLNPALWSVLENRLEVLTPRGPTDSMQVVPHRLERLTSSTFAVQLKTALRSGQTLELKIKPGAGDSSRSLVVYTGKAADSAQNFPLSYRPPEGQRDWLFWAKAATPSATGRATAFPLRRAGGDSLVSAPLPPGRYLIHGFADRDRDGVWNSGSLRPWIAQEPYEVMADTVSIGTKTEEF